MGEQRRLTPGQIRQIEEFQRSLATFVETFRGRVSDEQLDKHVELVEQREGPTAISMLADYLSREPVLVTHDERERIKAELRYSPAEWQFVPDEYLPDEARH
jgi:hypothetical protein